MSQFGGFSSISYIFEKQNKRCGVSEHAQIGEGRP